MIVKTYYFCHYINHHVRQAFCQRLLKVICLLRHYFWAIEHKRFQTLHRFGINTSIVWNPKIKTNIQEFEKLLTRLVCFWLGREQSISDNLSNFNTISELISFSIGKKFKHLNMCSNKSLTKQLSKLLTKRFSLCGPRKAWGQLFLNTRLKSVVFFGNCSVFSFLHVAVTCQSIEMANGVKRMITLAAIIGIATSGYYEQSCQQFASYACHIF